MRRILLGAAATAVALAVAACGSTTSAGTGHGPTGTATTSSATASGATTSAPTTSGHRTSARTTAPPTTTAPPPTTTAPPTTAPTTTPPAPRTTSPPVTHTPAAGGTRCHTSDLWAVFESLGAAAGNLYGKIVFTNHSESVCTVYGYGGIQLLRGPNGGLIPTRQVRNPDVPPVLITLRPGDHAYSRLHWSDAPGQGEPVDRQCEPTPTVLQVIPPDETTHLSAHWRGGPACQKGKIIQDAYRPGAGPAYGG